MMKKLFSTVILILAVVVSALGVDYCFADENAITVTSKSAYLMDYHSGEVIYSKNEEEKLTIASMTKIMLLNLCFEKLDEGEFTLGDDITVSEKASGMGGSQVFLEKNKPYKASELIKSIIVASANDASIAIAERLYGTEENCVQAMNDKCKEWGLNNTLFSNCTGLPKPTQYSCAKDVAVMLKHLLNHEEYFSYSNIWLDEIRHDGGRVTEINNTNKLIKYYEGCDGGKTGYTAESGFCLASTAKRGATRLISVIIKSSDSKTRFKEASDMLNYGFNNYASKMVVDSKTPLDLTVKVEKGRQSETKIIPEKDLFVFMKKGATDKISVDFSPIKVSAPVEKGSTVGELIVFKNNVEYGRVKVVALEDIDKKIYFDYIKDVSAKWNLA